MAFREEGHAAETLWILCMILNKHLYRVGLEFLILDNTLMGTDPLSLEPFDKFFTVMPIHHQINRTFSNYIFVPDSVEFRESLPVL
jgi:hypothetical protein